MPTCLSAVDNCWTAANAGANGSNVTYQWLLEHIGTGVTTAVGYGQTLTFAASSEGPGPLFNLVLRVSASVYISSSTSYPVTNQMSFNCGGFMCAQTTTSRAPTDTANGKRHR